MSRINVTRYHDAVARFAPCAFVFVFEQVGKANRAGGMAEGENTQKK